MKIDKKVLKELGISKDEVMLIYNNVETIIAESKTSLDVLRGINKVYGGNDRAVAFYIFSGLRLKYF